MPATCHSLEELKALADGQIGELSGEAYEDQLYEHLEVCPACAALHDQFQASIVENLRRPLPPRNEFDERVERLLRLQPIDFGPLPEATSDDTWEETARHFSPPEAPGELGRLGKYRILAPIDEGGMGRVFRAYDPVLRREVAVKLLRIAGRSTAAQKERLLQEARAVAKLPRDHVIPVFDVGEENGTPFIVMELLKGETLADRLKRGGLPLGEVCRLGGQIARGLAAAHVEGLVHRDVKPSNIMIGVPNPLEKALLFDFGLAREGQGADQDFPPTVLLSGPAGTPDYMAPEQKGSWRIDHRADLYSLALVLFEMATGRRLGASIVAEKANAELATVASPALARLLAGLLAVKPDDRKPQTAAAVAEELERIGRNLNRAGWQRRYWLFISLGILSIVVAVLIVRPGSPTGPRPAPPPTELWSPPVPGPAGPFPTLDHLSREGFNPALPPEVVAVMDGHTGLCRDLDLHPNGTLLASASDDGTIRLWDLAAPVPACRSVLVGHRCKVTAVAFTTDGRFLLTGDAEGKVQVRDVETGNIVAQGADYGGVLSLAVDPTGRWAAAGYENVVRVFEPLSPSQSTPVRGNRQACEGLAFTSDGRRLCIGSCGFLRVIDLARGEELLNKPSYKVWHYALARHPNGTLLAVNGLGAGPGLVDVSPNDPLHDQDRPDLASRVAALTIRDLNDSLAPRRTLAHDSRVVAASFSGDGTRLIALTERDLLYLWDWTNERSLASVQLVASERGERCLDAIAHPDGRHAIVSRDTGHLWVVRLAKQVIAD